MKTYTLIAAVQEIGGISKAKLEAGGTLTEWLCLPAKIRRQVFRDTATQDADEVAGQLPALGIQGIYSGDDLREWLMDPQKRILESSDVSLVAQYETTIRQLQSELEALRSENESLKALTPFDTFEPVGSGISAAGGRARAEKLSPERRREIARNAAMARYAKNNKEVAA